MKNRFLVLSSFITVSFIAAAWTLPVNIASASDQGVCERYCKKPRRWPKGLRYRPRTSRCNGQPTVVTTRDYANTFSLVGRNQFCEDRSDPAVSEPSDYKPRSRGRTKRGQYFCFRDSGQFPLTEAFSLKLSPTGTWGNGVECFKVRNIKKPMKAKKRR